MGPSLRLYLDVRALERSWRARSTPRDPLGGSNTDGRAPLSPARLRTEDLDYESTQNIPKNDRCKLTHLCYDLSYGKRTLLPPRLRYPL